MYNFNLDYTYNINAENIINILFYNDNNITYYIKYFYIINKLLCINKEYYYRVLYFLFNQHIMITLKHNTMEHLNNILVKKNILVVKKDEGKKHKRNDLDICKT